MKALKNYLMAAMVMLGVAGVALVPSSAYADDPPAPTQGTHKCPNGDGTYKNSPAECGLDAVEDGEKKDLMETIKTIINVVLSIVGVIAVAVIIIGGISFITSQGDSGKVTKARNTILYGVVGLVVALLAFAIVNFVLDNVFKKS